VSDRSEHLLAKLWHRANGDRRQPEGFLEDALAAALSNPDVWPLLRNQLSGFDKLPGTCPVVSTQDANQNGRTDIRLSWPSGQSLVLELKVVEPPSVHQVNEYLKSDAYVAAVAKLPAHLDVAPDHADRFLGVITWKQLRDVVGSDTSLPVRQFHHLLNAMNVVVPRLTSRMLEGMVTSWDAWDVADAWIYRGMEAVQQIFAKHGFACGFQERAREHLRIEEAWRRYAWWIWPPPWKEDVKFGIIGGLFLGRPPSLPLLCGDLPDLSLFLHLNPNSPEARQLRSDGVWQTVAQHWANRSTPSQKREVAAEHSPQWELIRVRESSSGLLAAADQGKALIDWLRDRAEEWVQEGIVEKLKEIAPSGKSQAKS
jgi:hypothetical protein